MAAPKTKTLKDLNGTWTLNKSLSDSPEAALALQGIAWMLRKTISMAPVSLAVKQYVAPPSAPADPSSPQCTHVDIEQTAAGLSGTTELRCLDNVFREHKDWLFGEVKGQTRWIKTADIVSATGDEWLAQGGGGGWLEGDEEKAGPDGETHMLSHVESVNGWTATQIWGFVVIEGKRRYARNIVVRKGKERVALRLVYDFVSE